MLTASPQQFLSLLPIEKLCKAISDEKLMDDMRLMRGRIAKFEGSCEKNVAGRAIVAKVTPNPNSFIFVTTSFVLSLHSFIVFPYTRIEK